MIGDEFFTKILDSIAFTSFVAQRGPPHRTCDLFDEVSINYENNNDDRYNYRINENLPYMAF